MKKTNWFIPLQDNLYQCKKYCSGSKWIEPVQNHIEPELQHLYLSSLFKHWIQIFKNLQICFLPLLLLSCFRVYLGATLMPISYNSTLFRLEKNLMVKRIPVIYDAVLLTQLFQHVKRYLFYVTYLGHSCMCISKQWMSIVRVKCRQRWTVCRLKFVDRKCEP